MSRRSGADAAELVFRAFRRQHTWRLMQGVASPPAAVFDSWNALWQGALSVHNRRLDLEVRRRLDRGDACFEWRVRPKPA